MSNKLADTATIPPEPTCLAETSARMDHLRRLYGEGLLSRSELQVLADHYLEEL